MRPPLIRPAVVLLALFISLTGLIYPLAVTLLAQVIFPAQANGSILWVDGVAVGSRLIGQPFDDPAYFWPRPSATAGYPYHAAASGGSNYAPTSAALRAQVDARVAALRAADPTNPAPIPVDLVTASASGLDPHLSPAAAAYQTPRVARARGLDPAQVQTLVEQATTGRLWGVLGEPRVNVLELNLALDTLTDAPRSHGQAVLNPTP